MSQDLASAVNDTATAPAVFDAILIGAGGAGMCLLLAMHEQGWLLNKRVLVLEPDPKDSDDRTWCFWARPEEPIAASLGTLATCTWAFEQRQGVSRPMHPYRYYHLRSSHLYRHVKDLMAAHPGVEWRPATAGAVYPSNSGQWVETNGQRLQARWVFDSRLSAEQQKVLSDDAGMLWQSFVGWRIRFPAAGLDPAAMRLMDFSVPQDGATQFMYLLPTSTNEALVELTRFGAAAIAADRAEAVLAEWIAAHLGQGYTITEQEKGRIPMSLRLNAHRPQHGPLDRHIPIGTAAGAVKSTTGYALGRMFTHAQGIVEAMLHARPCPTPFRARRFAFYDALLLHLLSWRPATGAGIFQQLFQRVPMRRILSFLDERTTLWQEIPLLLSLPPRPFLQALGAVNVRPALTRERGSGPSLVSLLPLLVVALALILQGLEPHLLQQIQAPLLLLGMAFPGIPHGALDHHLDINGRVQGYALLRFIVGYIAIMALVVFLWLLSPPVALLAFLLYSAWHFGETDVRHWGAFHSGSAWLHGTAALGFLLASHPQELSAYLLALGLGPLAVLPPLATAAAAVLCLLGLLATGLLVPRGARASWLKTCVVLLAGAFLPLLLAFGIYFIGIHSLRGWRHLQQGLGISHGALLRLSLPFTLGAFVLFAMLVAFAKLAQFSFAGIVPALFVFLAAISAPHIWTMHRFYGAPQQRPEPTQPYLRPQPLADPVRSKVA